MNDVGREAVAAAEEAAFGGTDVDDRRDRASLQARLSAVVDGPWWREYGPAVTIGRPRASDRSSSARTCGSGVEVRLASGQLTLATVVHELAHALAGLSHGHDPLFRAAYVDVTALLAGVEAARRLTGAFEAFGLGVGERTWPQPWVIDGDTFRIVP